MGSNAILLQLIDVSSRYLLVQPLKTMYANDCVEAFKKMIKTNQPEKVWTDTGTKFKSEFKTFVESKKNSFVYN